jgi:Cu/Ag efflux protein CusF
MKKLALMLLALLVIPTALSAAEVKGTILKVDKAENRIVLKTERGEETFETTKATKGIEHLKVGARVSITFSEKDGQPKVTEINPDG